MKRITKLLALGMAMTMTFGMTVSASFTSRTPSNPSQFTSLDKEVSGNKGVYLEKVDIAVGDAAAAEAYHGFKVGTALVNNGLLYNAPNVWVNPVTVFKARAEVGASGKIQWDPGFYYYDFDTAENNLATYNHTWGYVLVNLDKDATYSTVMYAKHEDGHAPDVCHQYYEGQLIHDSGDHEWHNYAVMRWELKWVNEQYKAELSYQVEQPNSLYTDHVAKAFKILDNDGLGEKIAEKVGGQLYAFQGALKANKVNLSGDTYVEFHLGHVDPAESKYVAVLFPYEMEAYSMVDWSKLNLGSLPVKLQPGNQYNDAKIFETGSVNFNIDMPTYVELTENDVRVNSKYGATLPQGTWLVAVMQIGVDSNKVLPTPEVQSAAAAPTAAAGANTGVQAAGVVSPKTGEMLPVAAILAVICLAGAAVCAKKARNNA